MNMLNKSVLFRFKSRLFTNNIVKCEKCIRWNHNLTFEHKNILCVKPVYYQCTITVKENVLKKMITLNVYSQQSYLFHTTSRVLTFWERDIKGGYPQDKSNMSRKQMVRDGLKQLGTEITMWKEEMKEKFESDPILVYRPGEIDKVWDFTNTKTYEQWVTTSDSDHGEGHSTSELLASKNGKALFTGNLSTHVPKDGRIKKAGYCNIKSIRARKSFKRESWHDWRMYTHVVLRVRGDGRSYLLNIATMGFYDIMWNDVYHFVLFTRGGPYWQTAKIPFSKFFLASKGRVQDKQCPIPLEKVTSLGISVGDKINGPFHLEIDYIGLEFDPTHTEEFAYEMYKMPKYIVAT